MPKFVNCCLCSKRTKPKLRRPIKADNLVLYVKKCLSREIDSGEIICNACYMNFQYKMRTCKSMGVTFTNPEPGTSKDPDYVPKLPNKTVTSPKLIQLNIATVSRSHKYCIVCKKHGNYRNHLTTVPSDARTQAFIENGIYIDSKNRCCAHHLEKSYFNKTSLSLLSVAKMSDRFSRTDIVNLLQNVRTLMKSTCHLNFDIPSLLSDGDYSSLTGLNKDNFSDLSSYLISVRQSSVRSVRTCLAVFLVKLRTGLSNGMLGILFGLKKFQIQRIIHSVRSSLMTNFVPNYIGFEHISHDDFCMTHTTAIAKKLFASSADDAVVVLDGTYIYIQKSGNYMFQRRSFSMHKHRPLVKAMVVVGTDGYILSILGPYYSDGKNNDASITKHLFAHNMQNVNAWFKDNDVCIVDRGFRDAVHFLEEKGLNVKMPIYLQKGQKQHTTEEANVTRLVTKVRWVVESANGRLKQFKLLDKVVHNTLLPCIGDFVQIVGAICNKYMGPLASRDPALGEIAEIMLQKVNKGNEIQQYLEDNDLLRKRSIFKKLDANSDELRTFPILSLDHLREITLGVYQLKQAASYSTEHMNDDGEYELLVCRETPTLIKVQIKSRHTSHVVHNLWIKYRLSNDTDPIEGWYCTCKVGARVVGCCAHIASVLWFLGMQRLQPDALCKPRTCPLMDASQMPESEDISRSDSEVGSSVDNEV